MTMQTPSPIQPSTGIEHIEAYEATQSDRDAVRLEAMAAINVDLPLATSRAAAAATRAARYAAELAQLPVPADILARVTRFGLAAAQAHILHLAAEQPSPEIAAMAEPLYETREMLIADARALVARKLIQADVLSKLSGTRGHRDLGFDIMLLCTVFRSSWANIQGRSAVRLDELDPIHKQAERLVAAVGLRDDREKQKTHAHQQRVRAFHLLAREYDQLRRALTFILWGVAEVSDVAPPFTGGRGRTSAEEPAAEGAQPEGEADAPVIATGGGTALTGTPGSGPFTTE